MREKHHLRGAGGKKEEDQAELKQRFDRVYRPETAADQIFKKPGE